jgi:hypothetical protein
MRAPRIRFTVRRLILIVAAVGIVLGLGTMSLRWHRNPYVTVTVRNSTSEPLTDVRIRYRYGECTARMIRPGADAAWRIRCTGASDVVLEYRDSHGVLVTKSDTTYIERHYRGSLDLHIGDTGVRVVDRTSFSSL